MFSPRAPSIHPDKDLGHAQQQGLEGRKRFPGDLARTVRKSVRWSDATHRSAACWLNSVGLLTPLARSHEQCCKCVYEELPGLGIMTCYPWKQLRVRLEATR